jgi:hypothetical protein
MSEPQFKIHKLDGATIAEVISDEILVNSGRDALDLMMEAVGYGVHSLIVHERNLHPTFFDLRSGLAGEILQKGVNYQVKLAIIGEFEKYTSKSLHALIVESNRGTQTLFVADVVTAIAKFTAS